MKKSEISEELITKIKIELDTLFYIPEETIKGTIKLYPGIKLETKNNKLHLKLKIFQYEFWEYTNIEIDELKNIYKTEISTNNITYELKENEKPNYNEKEKINLSNSIILIEKEDKDKVISIPFEYKIIKDILPTFQFETDKYILGIRHLLIVECEEYNSLNYIGLFIGKQKNENLSESKTINDKYKSLFDDIDIKVLFEKESYYFGEDIKMIIKNNAKYTFDSGKITFKQNLYRKIQWIGYLKNTLLDKKIIFEKVKENIKSKQKDNDQDTDNDLEFFVECFEIFARPLGYSIIGEGIGGLSGAIIGGIICPHVLLGMFLGGTLSFFIGGYGGISAGILANHYSPGQNKFTNYFKYNTNNINDKVEKLQNGNNSSIENLKDENEDVELKEELQKFVYFKNNKIIGFIKFKDNITPPVNGYYFKCDFNFNLDVEISGVFKDTKKKILKRKIDFYDGNEYINKMKKLLNTNSLI